jgi:hypothetical protein
VTRSGRILYCLEERKGVLLNEVAPAGAAVEIIRAQIAAALSRTAAVNERALWRWSMPALLKSLLDSRIGNQPQERGEHIQCAGDPGAHKRERDCSEVERGREFAFPIFANSQREKRFAALFGDDGALENIVGNHRHQQYEALNRGPDRSNVIFTHPCRSEWEERQSEQEMKVGPENPAADLLSRLEQVMIVVPIDTEVNET